MLIEIYDYAAKLLNNMTATTASIINNLASGAEGTAGVDRADRAGGAERTASPNPTTATNLTSKLLQATTGNMKTLLNRTLATMGGQRGTLTTLLLQGGLGTDVASGQRVRQLADANGSVHATGNESVSHGQDMYNAFNVTSPSSSSSPSAHTVGFIESSTTAASTVLSSAITNLPATSGPAATFPAQTMATIIAAGNKNRATTIILYPTVSPESIVIPIVSCIFGFPILALIVICCLRRRAKLARERDRRRNYDMQDHAVSLVRFSPIHRLSEFECCNVCTKFSLFLLFFSC
ncbi:uncharacterized protein LOC108656520, partial [Drosophila navojoa]|uniref:uncharacterized protein LOC108656520 n=1 Tax=Drosophila navojoa TaxID=7232 RepID=UPI0011BEE745